MAVPVLQGLVTSGNTRGRDSITRKVFYSYPTGSFPIAGFLSLTEEEETNSGKFTWFEDRHPDFRTIYKNISTTVVACDTTAPYSALTADIAALSNDDAYGINVEDRSYIQIGDVLDIGIYDLTTSAVVHCKLTVTELPDAPDTRVIGLVHGLTADLNVDFNYDYFTPATNLEVVRIDTNARAEGSGLGGDTGWLREPVEHYGYCQTLKNPFQLSEEEKVSAQDYDGKGVYETLYKQHALKHLESKEKLILFGERHIRTVNGIPTKYSGGIEFYLKEWEKADSPYRGTGSPAVTSDSDDNKRIIENAGGTMTYKQLLIYIERLFRETNNMSNAKICVCGGIAFMVLNEIFDGKVSFEESSIAGELKNFGATWKGVTTPYGDIHFVVHPLFRRDPERKYWLMFIDFGNLKWFYMKGRNTILRESVQDNDEDIRKDLFLTNGGVRVMFPESHMIIKNVKSAA